MIFYLNKQFNFLIMKVHFACCMLIKDIQARPPKQLMKLQQKTRQNGQFSFDEIRHDHDRSPLGE